MRTPDNVDVTLNEVKSFSAYLTDLIEDGTFYQLPFRERYRHIKHIKQLYNKLRGPVSDVKIGRILAAATVLAFVVPIKIGPGLTFTPASLLVGCSVNTSDQARAHVISQLVLSMAPTTLSEFELTISGADIDPIVETYTGDITEISIEVPAGEARQFDLVAVVDPAEHSSIISYGGSSTLDLIAGETVEIALDMQPVPVEPLFAAPVMNPFGISGLTYQGHPSFADLDGDGDLDLLVIDDVNGYGWQQDVLYLENTGTRDVPSFMASVTNLFSLNLQPPYNLVHLTIGDLDDDGDFDIMTGDYYYASEFAFFENTGTVTTPNFPSYVPNAYSISTMYTQAYPAFGDLDNDGDLDLIVGDYNFAYPYILYGRFQYMENNGTPTSPNFATSDTNPFGITGVTDDAYPVLVDLNGDGDLDILAGDQAGNLHYFENTGTASVPTFAPPVQNPFGLTSIGVNAVPTLGDIDGDGDLDLLVGSGSDSDLRYFENLTL